MQVFTQALLGSLNNGVLWQQLLFVVPILVITFTIAFGLNMLRNWITTKRINSFLAEGGLHTSEKALRDDSFYDEY